MDNPELQAAGPTTPKFSLAGEQRDAKCVYVYDGDTAQFVFQPLPNTPYFRFSCRMLGYNSAEIRTANPDEKEKALEAREALNQKIHSKYVKLHFGDFDKYGRPLVHVYCDDENINDWMLENGHGRPYTGRGSKAW